MSARKGASARVLARAEEGIAIFCAGGRAGKIREGDKKALTKNSSSRKFAILKGGDNHHGNEESRCEEGRPQEGCCEEDDQEEVSASDRAGRTRGSNMNVRHFNEV
ncbi:MAG TPA: hypothetical protein VFE58_17860 [Tepidisphaeraceae bacterium]|jgi:hypothetical protein|nr:hypothetical protein [Tepidisphaeraceae bacterium]